MKFNLRSIIWLGFLGRVLVAISTDSLNIGLKVGADLNRWHLLAVNILEGSPDQYLELDAWGSLYAYYLAFIYSLTTDSLLIENFSFGLISVIHHHLGLILICLYCYMK